MDVERYEIPVILGLTTNVGLLSFECNLPDFKNDVVTIIHHLSERDLSIRFDLVTTEPPLQFVLVDWVNKERIAEFVHSMDLLYCGIFAHSTNM